VRRDEVLGRLGKRIFNEHGKNLKRGISSYIIYDIGTSFTVLGGTADRSLVLSTIVGKGGLAETLKTRGGPHRNETQLIEVHLNQLSMQHELYPETCCEASRQIVVLRFELNEFFTVLFLIT